MEPTARIELATPSLPRMCSTTEPRGQKKRRLAGTRCGAGDGIRTHDIQLGRLELYQLSYTRVSLSALPAKCTCEFTGGGGRIRTFVVRRRQIYSLLPLATRVPLRTLEPMARLELATY